MIHLNEFLVKKEGPKNFKPYNPETTIELQDAIIETLMTGSTNLNYINTSKIRSMRGLFANINSELAMRKLKIKLKNFDISTWDVSNVTNMEEMFKGCTEFDCDLSDWNVSKVKSFNNMFRNCKSFEGKGLDNWKINPNIKSYNMSYMFDGCTSLKTKPSWYNE